MHGTTKDPVKHPVKLAYRHEYFVDREQELKEVLGKARRIANGKLERRRVIVCRGSRGGGKTWLLKELERLAPENGIHPCYQELKREHHVQELRRALALQPRPLLLLLDVDGATDEMLREFGNRVLGRLVTDIRVLVVLTERGEGHFWGVPQIDQSSEDLVLNPFEERDDLEALIRKQVPDAIVDLDDVLKLGGGFPWVSYLLVASRQAGLEPLGRCIDILLEGINGKLRHQFEALSVLRSFNEDRMAPLLKAYSAGFAKREWDHEACRDLARVLVDSTLARYMPDYRAYVIDEPLRQVMVGWLHTFAPELWAKLHQVAYEVYDEFSVYQPQTRQWQEEKAYHASCLREAGWPLPSPVLPGSRKEGEENG